VAQVEGDEETVPTPNQLGDREIEPGLPWKKRNGRVHFGNETLLLRDEVGMIADEPPDIGEGLVGRLDDVREIIEGGEEEPCDSFASPRNSRRPTERKRL
jgi:hypothetical protein